MSTSKYISLEEAREEKKLGRFIKEHQSEGEKNAFLVIIEAMVRKPESGDQTSDLKHRDEG